MKKLISVLIVLALCLSMIPAVLAEAEVTTLSWEDFEAAIAEQGLEGEFVDMGVGLKAWIPAALEAVELTEEDVEAGYVAYFMTADESAALGVTCYEVGVEYDELKAELEEVGAYDMADAVINGEKVILYTVDQSEDLKCNVACLLSSEGYAVEFAFTAGDEGFEAVSAMIVASIQAA